MKILITGKPKSGKSTLLEQLISDIKNKKGFITKEITDKNGKRIGFKVITSERKMGFLANVNIKSKYKIAKYFVDVKGFDKLIKDLFTFNKNQFLYIDEIGGMELLSDKFRRLVELYLNSKNTFIATLTAPHYSDSFIDYIKKRRDVKIIEIAPENREEKLKEIRNLLK